MAEVGMVEQDARGRGARKRGGALAAGAAWLAVACTTAAVPERDAGPRDDAEALAAPDAESPAAPDGGKAESAPTRTCGGHVCAPSDYCVVTTARLPTHHTSVQHACRSAPPVSEILRCAPPTATREIRCVRIVREP